MVLESLLELVETLRGRIDEHGEALRQSEALTRAALIDPLLRELGWDTENPAMVVPEYRSAAGFADYALMNDSSQPPALIVEAKKLGESLDDKVALQSLNYCNLIGTPHFALTDGKTWKIYSTFEQAPLADRLIATFSIGEMSAAEVCLQALALWRHSVEVGVVSAAKTPIVGLDGTNHAPAPESVPQVRPEISATETEQDWIPLSDLSPKGGTAPPIEIKFPDGSSVALGRWNTVAVESVRWLYNNNYLDAGNWRIQRGARYIVSDTSIHPSGKEFTRPSNVGPLHVEINYDGLNQVKNACLIIERAGQDTVNFKVRF